MRPPEPLDAGALIRPELGAELPSCVHGGEGFGRAQAVEGALHPGSRLHARPFARRFRRRSCGVPLERRAGQETHRLVKRNPVTLRGALHAFPMLENLAKARAVGLDPPAPEEDQPLGRREDGAGLALRERLAVDREARVEVQHSAGTELRGRPSAHGHAHLSARRRARVPPIGYADDDPRALERGDLLQERVRLARRPRERVIEVPTLDHPAHERALVGGALHRQEQRQQKLAIARGARLLERAAERTVLWRTSRRKARRVRRKEGEGTLRIALVLRQMKAHAPNCGPRVAAAPQPFGHRPTPGRQLERQRVEGLAPDRYERIDGDVLGAEHRRRCGDHRLDPV